MNDGSCDFGTPSCSDSEAINYFSKATVDDGSCIYAGCTDSLAPNFDSRATVEDSSCEPYIAGCADSNAANYFSSVTVNLPETCRYPGCTDSRSNNFNSRASFDDGSCLVLGCTDSSAVNFDTSAEQDDGTCEFAGCMDSRAVNYNSAASVEGECKYRIASGAVANIGWGLNCAMFVDGDNNLRLSPHDAVGFSSECARAYGRSVACLCRISPFGRCACHVVRSASWFVKSGQYCAPPWRVLAV